jgi:hypothetical protein
METLRDWVSRWDQLGPEAFANSHNSPFLLRLSRSEDEAGSTGEDKRFLTMAVGKSTQTRADPLELPVYEVKKAEGNVFGMMITIGRAANNDLVVDASSVSKFHAYLEQKGEGWAVRDANSSNGTFANGKEVGSNESTGLGDGSEVKFARVPCRFMLGETFRAMLEKEAARLRRRGEL